MSGLRQDKMTSAERQAALLTGKPVDRVPLLFVGGYGFCAKNAGYTIADIYNDPQKNYNAQVWTMEQYGFQILPVFAYGAYGAWEFGGEVKIPQSEFEQAPEVTRFPVQVEEDVKKLELPDARTAGMVPAMMEFCKIVANNNLPVQVSLGSPIMRAGNLCGVANLCRWMVRKPDLVHRLLRLVTDHEIEVAKYWVETFGAANVMAREGSGTESNQIISPKQFETFAMPYLKEAHARIFELGIKRFSNMHVCGEESLNLPFWAQLDMGDHSVVSIDHETDIDTAIKYFGDRCIIAGNIDSAIVMSGTPEEIYEACRPTIVKGKCAPEGFMLTVDCEIPPATPPYNVYALRKAIDDFGWYD